MICIPRMYRVTAGTILLILTHAVFGAGQQPLTLKQADDAAAQNHTRLNVARLTADPADQVSTEIHSAIMPNLITNFTGASALDNSRIAAGGLNNPVIYDRVATGMAVSQLITDFGRTSKLVKSSEFHAAAQKQVTDATRAQVLLDVDRAYFGVLRAQAILRVAVQTVKARQAVLDQVTELTNNKLKSELDLSFAKVNLADAELLRLNAENEVRAGFAELAQAMGNRSAQAYQLAEEPLPGPLPPRPEDLVAPALRDRRDVAALRLEQDSAIQFSKAERALLFPSISAVTNLGVIPGHADALSNRYGAFGFNLSVPIFNGKLYTARRREAELKAAASTERVEDISNLIARDVTAAWLRANIAFQRIALTAQMLDQAQLALDLTQTRYDLGLNSIVELSQAQLNETTAEIANASAKYDYQLQRSILAYHLGQLY